MKIALAQDPPWATRRRTSTSISGRSPRPAGSRPTSCSPGAEPDRLHAEGSRRGDRPLTYGPRLPGLQGRQPGHGPRRRLRRGIAPETGSLPTTRQPTCPGAPSSTSTAGRPADLRDVRGGKVLRPRPWRGGGLRRAGAAHGPPSSAGTSSRPASATSSRPAAPSSLSRSAPRPAAARRRAGLRVEPDVGGWANPCRFSARPTSSAPPATGSGSRTASPSRASFNFGPTGHPGPRPLILDEETSSARSGPRRSPGPAPDAFPQGRPSRSRPGGPAPDHPRP